MPFSYTNHVSSLGRLLSPIASGISFLMVGASIGWLLGISVSPVLHIIVGAIAATVGGVLSTLNGSTVTSSSQTPVTANTSGGQTIRKLGSVAAGSAALIMAGIVFGSCVGIYVRTNESLGPDINGFVQRWKSTGLTDVELRRRLFDEIHPMNSAPAAPNVSVKATATDEQPATVGKPSMAALFVDLVQDCDLIRLKKDAELKAYLQALNQPSIDTALRYCRPGQFECADVIKEILCASRK